jgi:hypothetical protein
MGFENEDKKQSPYLRFVLVAARTLLICGTRVVPPEHKEPRLTL